ncbi:MAG: glycosyltransferase family 2 protein [Paracoccaceae bacterium]|nr:glycosyltransferase family 2 protein [Paracoccaceae bacterium]
MAATGADWGICTTVKAPKDQVLAFVAHHLGLGAARIWLHFDDPDDGAHDAVAGLKRVTAVRCDAAYWRAVVGRRPDKHQNRQSRNMQRVYGLDALPWVAHIDVDEFLWTDHDIGALLDAVAPDQPMMRMAPWEALHDPDLPDDIFTAGQFRGALRGPQADAARRAVFGRFAALLPSGVLSHAAGKCFFRTGLARFEPRLHGAFRAGVRVPGGPFCAEIALLHFHAEDPARWKDRLAFRLTRGAYQYNPDLQAWLLAADAAMIDGFYRNVQQPATKTLATLRDLGILIEADLGLRAKVAALRR